MLVPVRRQSAAADASVVADPPCANECRPVVLLHGVQEGWMPDGPGWPAGFFFGRVLARLPGMIISMLVEESDERR